MASPLDFGRTAGSVQLVLRPLQPVANAPGEAGSLRSRFWGECGHEVGRRLGSVGAPAKGPREDGAHTGPITESAHRSRNL